MKDIQNKIEKITYQALLFLAGQQKRNGGFLSLTSSDKNGFGNTKTYPTTFFTANILSCLNLLPCSSLADSVRKKAARFLLFEKGKFWSFNYWQRNSAEAKLMPYPDDLDDTACALAALAGFDPKLITGKALANVVKILTAAETNPGGPYKTWLADGKAKEVWQDVDLAVNANIANFLSMQKTELPNLTELFDKAIKINKFESSYYPEIFPVIYFISRSYKGKQNKKLTGYLLSRRLPDFSWGNPLNTALAVSALINSGFHKLKELEKSIGCLIDNFNGKSWQPYAFCLDPARQGRTHFAGSSALTTAFCLEVMNKYLLLQKQLHQQETKEKIFCPQENKIYRRIVRLAKNRFATLAPEVKDSALQILEKTTTKDTDRQIVLLSFWFRVALGKNGKSITDEQITALGLANLYGWIAYGIYDDFFDGEGKIDLLPVANIGLREVTAFYARLLGNNNDNYKTIKRILDNIDAANAWESRYCRGEAENDRLTVPKHLPNFKNLRQLADKSLGHALGPIAILMLLDFKHDSWQVKELLSFFSHYLIARQLNDDAHDWLEDLRSGRINSVGAEVLAAFDKKTFNFQRDERKLQKLFWNDILPQAAQNIFKHVKSARLALSHIGVIEKPDALLNLLIRPEAAARQALEESKKMRDFLSSY
jgi:hypothetical protein